MAGAAGVTHVKICGLTNFDDARHAARAGADLLGFVFAQSPRQVTVETVRAIVRDLRREGLAHESAVGVFVDLPAGEVIAACLESGLTIAQLHGSETPDDCRLVAQAGLSVIKSFRVRDHVRLEDIARYDAIDFVHFDTYDPQQAGGTGRAFDHSLVAGLSERFRLILAGGLTPKNVAEAVARVRPWGVDVSSGVEAAPGRKDPALVEEFIRQSGAG